jgi:hypothetical protein
MPLLCFTGLLIPLAAANANIRVSSSLGSTDLHPFSFEHPKENNTNKQFSK